MTYLKQPTTSFPATYYNSGRKQLPDCRVIVITIAIVIATVVFVFGSSVGTDRSVALPRRKAGISGEPRKKTNADEFSKAGEAEAPVAAAVVKMNTTIG